jgi:AraC family transcriptional regulator
MTIEDTPLVRAMSEEAIRRIAHKMPYRTSGRLNWSGVEVHRYKFDGAGESVEHSYPRLSVFLHHSEQPVNGELRVGGITVRARLDNDTVSIAPPGLPLSTRRDGSCEVTAIFLDPLMISDIARAETGIENPEVLPQYGIHDSLIRAIGMTLDAELASERPTPRVYPESLAAALAAHIFARYTNPVFRGAQCAGLNRTQLRRVLDFIQENLERDLALDEIAAVANLSKYHFAKSFRAAMGIAPHQYIVKVRIEKARKLLAVDSISVEEVANRVGYSDKGHFAYQFHKIVGVSPNRYRLNS